MKMTYDDQYLITASDDACLMIWRVWDKEGRGVKHDREVPYAEEILITKSDLEEKVSLDFGGHQQFRNWEVSWVPINVNGYQSDAHLWNKKHLLNIPFIMLLLIISDIHLCADTDHVNVTFKTGPRATQVVVAGDSMPVGTTLMTPGLDSCYLLYLLRVFKATCARIVPH